MCLVYHSEADRKKVCVYDERTKLSLEMGPQVHLDTNPKSAKWSGKFMSEGTFKYVFVCGYTHIFKGTVSQEKTSVLAAINKVAPAIVSSQV